FHEMIAVFFLDRCFLVLLFFFFFSSRRRHTRSKRDRSSDVCSSDLSVVSGGAHRALRPGPFPQDRVPRADTGRVRNANHGTEAAGWNTGPPPSHAAVVWRPRRV